MDPADIQKRLLAGIQAVQRGDHAQGRQLLLQVVEVDEHNEPAWLWLSQSVDDLEDKRIALENVLTLNPANEQARAMLREVKAQLGMPETPPPAPPESALQPAPRLLYTPPDPDDDPFQCAYCGRPAAESDEECPHCGQSLMKLEKWTNRSYINSLVILLGMDLQLAVLFMLGPPSLARLMEIVGPPGQTGNPVAEAVAQAKQAGLIEMITAGALPLQVVRATVLLAVFLMAYTDMDFAFPAAILFGAADILWNLVTMLLGIIGPAAAVPNAVVGLIAILIGAAAWTARRNARQRIRVTLDRNTVGAMGMYHRGREYAGRGMWALAAMHWQRAVALQPANVAFYKELGRALIHLGRNWKAIQVLEEGARRAPVDASLSKLLEQARAAEQTETPPGRPT